MAHTTPTPTLNSGSTPTKLVEHPEWCAGRHADPDPNHYGAWIHETDPHTVPIEDSTGEILISLSRFDETDLNNVGQTTVTVVFDCDDHHAEYELTVDQAQEIVNALLDAVNRTLPDEQQTFLGPPGFEYVRYDNGFGDLNGL